MIKPIQAILYILRGNLTLENKTVPVIKRNYPLDKTPCVNVDDSAGVVTVNKRRMNLKDENGEPREYLRTTRRTTLNIHSWTDNENQREELNNQIIKLFTMAYNDHYFFCLNYEKDTQRCKYLDSTCNSISRGKHLYKSSKNKCPQPIEYHYKNIFTEYDLIKNSWDLRTPYSNDNIQVKPPALHSIFKLDTTYYDYTRIGGITSNNLYIRL